MSWFSRILAFILLAALLLLPLAAAFKGWGLPGERSARIVRESGEYCSAYSRDAYGNCRRSHRSYFHGRSHMGGGFLGGK